MNCLEFTFYGINIDLQYSTLSSILYRYELKYQWITKLLISTRKLQREL